MALIATRIAADRERIITGSAHALWLLGGIHLLAWLLL